MDLGFVGLGRMGANMVRRLRRTNIEIAAFNRSSAVTQELAKETGIMPTASLEELVKNLPAPRVIWLMLPAGEITQQYIDQLVGLLNKGDILIDGANSFYKDSMRRAHQLSEQGIHFVDAGVSGGVWGLENGYALMVGGETDIVRTIEPMLIALAPAADKGWVHCGPAGSGHFVKMIHNGIEYGMMQAYAEGFALMKARTDFDLDLGAIAESWRHGSVVRSWLLDLSCEFLKVGVSLEDIEPYVDDSGEGRWTAMEAIEQGIPAPVMSLALMMRFASQGNNDTAARMLAMMRKGFGGHAVKSNE